MLFCYELFEKSCKNFFIIIIIITIIIIIIVIIICVCVVFNTLKFSNIALNKLYILIFNYFLKLLHIYFVCVAII